MRKYIRFTIPGKPIAKRRHRDKIVKRDKVNILPGAGAKLKTTDFYAVHYASGRAVSEEAYIKMVAQLYRPEVPYNEPMFIYEIFYFPIPASTSKRDMELIEQNLKTPGKTPDHDNQVKAVCDAFNEVIWKDDKLVDRNFIERYYSSAPRTEILVGPFHNAPPIPKGLVHCINSIKHDRPGIR